MSTRKEKIASAQLPSPTTAGLPLWSIFYSVFAIPPNILEHGWAFLVPHDIIAFPRTKKIHGNKQLRIVRTRHSLPLIAIIMYPPGRMFWSVTNNKYCDGTFPQDYNNLEQAKAACLNLGARCYGIHDYRCGGRAFNLCQSSHLRHSSVGSCVHASPKWTGLFD